MPDVENRKRYREGQLPTSPYQTPGIDDPLVLDLYSTPGSGGSVLQSATQAGIGSTFGSSPTPDPYTAPGAGGSTNDYVGNQFLDNPAAAVNNIMQGLGLSVSGNSPFYNAMSQLAPGLEWLQYFGTGTGSPGTFLNNVGDWFNGGTGGLGNAFNGGANMLGNALATFLAGGGGSADLSAMIDNMTPEDITRAIAAMMETGMYGSAGSRVRQGLQSRLVDQFNLFSGQRPAIEAGLQGTTTTIADAFLDFLNKQGLLGQLGF